MKIFYRQIAKVIYEFSQIRNNQWRSSYFGVSMGDSKSSVGVDINHFFLHEFVELN